MKAISIDEFGDIGKTVHLEDVPVPTPGLEEVLIEVRAAGVNPIDWKMAERGYGGGGQFPMVLGNDVADVVVQAGSAVNRRRRGEMMKRQSRVLAGSIFVTSGGNDRAQQKSPSGGMQ